MKKILFISASPKGMGKLKVAEEFKILDRIIEDSVHKFYEINNIADATVDDALRIQKRKPNILHIAAHGSAIGGFFVVNGSPNSKYKKLAFAIGESEINMILEDTPSIQFMFINACYSDNIVETTKEFLEYSIGFEGKVADNHAIEFAKIFYENFIQGSTVFDAFKKAKNSMRFKKAKNFNPVFHSRTCLIMEEINTLTKRNESLESLKQSYSGKLKNSDQILLQIASLENEISNISKSHDDATARLLIKNPHFKIVIWFKERRKELSVRIAAQVIKGKVKEQERNSFEFDLDMLFDCLDYLLLSHDYKEIDEDLIMDILSYN
jgi:CHAT domain